MARPLPRSQLMHPSLIHPSARSIAMLARARQQVSTYVAIYTEPFQGFSVVVENAKLLSRSRHFAVRLN